MKKFILYTVLFIFPIIAFNFFTNVIQAPNAWTFRCWEGALVYNNYFVCSVGKLYAKLNMEKLETGDLGHRSGYSIEKYIVWKTDEYGFRNSDVSPKDDIDIVVVGDSFTAGSDLTQDQTFSYTLGKITGKKVYQMAPIRFPAFRDIVETKLIKKPKIVIFSVVERFLGPSDYPLENLPAKTPVRERVKYAIADKPIVNQINTVFDKMFKNASLNSIRASLLQSKGKGVQSPVSPNFFFWEGSFKRTKLNESDYTEIINRLKDYKKYCDGAGIKFVFMPCPDKETIYYNLVPFKERPQLLEKLYNKLDSAGITYINNLKAFESGEPGKLLYYPDDTHWNPYGVRLVADYTAKNVLPYIK